MAGCWAWLAALALGWIAGPALAEEGTLANPGFELPGKDGTAQGWRSFPIRGKVVGSFAGVAGGRNGTGCQQIRLDRLMDGWLQLATPIRGGVVAGHDYETRVWMRGHGYIHNASLLVQDANDWFPNELAAVGASLEAAWSEVSLRFRATKTEPKALLAIKLNQEGAIDVDDAAFTELKLPEQAAPVGNQLRNGSFEVGLDGWASKWMEARAVDDARAVDGRRCAELPGGAPDREFCSVLTPVVAGHSYTVSLSLRAEQPIKAKVSLRSGYNDHAVVAGEQELAVGPAWTSSYFSAVLPPTPNGSFYVCISPGPAKMWIDAVSLSADGQTAYRPHAEIEAGLDTDRADGIYRRGERVVGRLRLYNAGQAPRTVALNRRLVDAFGRVVSAQPVTVQAAPGTTEQTLNLTPGVTGAFRAECVTGDGTAQPFAERAFTVLPDLPISGGESSSMGTHVDFGAPERPLLGGARWAKTWWLGWDRVEPKPGEWQWAQDDLITRWRQAGLSIMAVLSGPPEREQQRPANALAWAWYPPRDPARMREYARRTVEHYKDRIRVWELTNEPNSGLHALPGQTFAQAYAQHWRALAEGVRQADPTATIVAGSFTLVNDPGLLLREILELDPGLYQLCDAVSYHNYNANPASTMWLTSSIRDAMGRDGRTAKPIWDTEWSPVETPEPVYLDAPRNLAVDHAPAARTAAMVVQGFASRLGLGVARSFLYHAYGGQSMSRYEFDMWYELDGRPRPVLAAQATAAAMLSGAKPSAVTSTRTPWAFRFTRPDGKALLVAWADDSQPTRVPLAVPGGWQAVDMMGNRLATVPDSVGWAPVYLLEP